MNNSQNMESTIPPQPAFEDGINMPPDNHYVQNENHCQRLLNNKCCNFFLCIGRWVPVVIVSAILTWVYYAFVIELCLHIIESIVKKVIFLSIFHFLVIMLYWSYWATILAKNMTIPNQFYLPSEVTEALRVSGSNEVAKEIVAKYVLEQKLPIKNRMHDQAYRYCSHCTMVKPDRAHHCSICKTCNLKFDHHCPWINNCVMYSNYKQFLLFLGYGFTLCVFVAITNIDALVTFFNTTQNGSTSLSISKSFHLIFLEFISVMFGISISVILVFHIYLVLKNRTTLETYKSPTFDFGVDKMAYNRSYLQNLREVFGSSILLAFVPIFSSGSDGIFFPHKNSHSTVSYSTVENGPVSNQTDESTVYNNVNAPLSPKELVNDVNYGMGTRVQMS